jgi:hypothetical protein
MTSIVESKEHPTMLFRRGEVGAEARALKWLQETAKATPHCISRGQELSCSCLHQLTTDEFKSTIVPYIAHFSKLNVDEQKMAAMELIRASQKQFRDAPTAPKQLKHLRFRLPTTNDEPATGNPSTNPHLVCQSTIMVLIGKSRYWWDSCVALVKNNEMPPSKPKNETQSDDEKRKKQNKRCSASKLKRQKRGQLGAIKGHVFAKCGGSNPTCTSAPGNAQKREEAKAWLQKARPILMQHKESRKEEFYNGGAGKKNKRKNNVPHIYTGAQFCIKSELPQECKAIKVLGDAVFKVDLNKCHDFDDFVGEGDHFLCCTAEAGLDLIKEKPEFLGAQIREQQQEQWDQVVNSLDTVKKPSEIIEENGDLQDPRAQTFKAAVLHDQIEEDRGKITFYEKHKDKAGNLVMFFPLTGESFNFIAMQSTHENAPADGQKEIAKLETTNAGYKKYEEYKAILSKTQTGFDKVNEFTGLKVLRPHQ